MTRWWKGSLAALTITALCAVALTSTATAKPSEVASHAAAARTLTIYGLGNRDEIAQERLDLANKLMDSLNVTVSNPVGGFNDQAFLSRLAARDIPDLVHMGRDSVGTYAARNALLPL